MTERWLEGELVWDVAGRRPRSIVLEAELDCESSSLNAVLQDGRQREIRYTTWSSGQLESVVRVESGPASPPQARRSGA